MRRADAKEMKMNLADPSAPLLVVCGGDTVKVFDLTVQSGDPCTLSYTPTPGSLVNSVKWNHTNHVVASAGDDKKISLWRKNGKSLGTLHLSRNFGGEIIDESIFAINFCNKGSRYLCSGGSGRIVRVWDLQKKLCIKKLIGHTDTITGVMYNCKDEHLASISLKGDLILHNLASGSLAASLKDPNGQALRVLDYSRYSRQVLVTAGDDGSVILWDTTAKNPKMSWLKVHSAPTTGVCVSPSSDKIFASVGLDKKLYLFDSSSKKPTNCIPYEAPFSSLAFRDDGYILAAGTNSGRVVFYDVRGKPQSLTALLAYSSNEAVTGLCWQKSKTEVIDGNNCTDDIALLGSNVEDSILMPDPLPSVAALNFPAANSSDIHGSLTTNTSIATTKYSSSLEGTPLKVHSSSSLTRLNAPRNSFDLKDDMDVFSPLVDVQPITPFLSNILDGQDDGLRDGLASDKKSSLFSAIHRFPHLETTTDSQTVRDRRFRSTSSQDHATSTVLQSHVKPTVSSKNESAFSLPSSRQWDSNAFIEKSASRDCEGLPSVTPILPTESAPAGSKYTKLDHVPDSPGHSLRSSLSSSYSGLTNHQFGRDTLPIFSEGLSVSGESRSFGQSAGPSNLDVSSSLSMLPRKFLTNAERMGATTSFTDGITSTLSSPKLKKMGSETRVELLSSRQDTSASMGMRSLPVNGIGIPELQQEPVPSTDQQQGLSSFSLQLIQRTLEETLASVQKSIHNDVRNLHIDLIRQFHMLESEMINFRDSVLEKQDELMKEVQLLKKENQQLRQLL